MPLAGGTRPVCLCTSAPGRRVPGIRTTRLENPGLWCLPSCDKSFFSEGNVDQVVEWGNRGPKGKGPASGQRVVQGTVEPAAPWLGGRAGVAHIPRGPGSGLGEPEAAPTPQASWWPSAELVPRRRPDHRTFLTFRVWHSRGRLRPCGGSGLTQPQTTASSCRERPRRAPGTGWEVSQLPSRLRPSPGCPAARVQPVANGRVEVRDQGRRAPRLHALDFPHRGAIRNI